MINRRSSPLQAITLQPDGKMLICGAFPMSTSARRQTLARLEAGGSLDESFQPGGAVDRRVTSLVVQPDGKVLIGGEFLTAGGLDRSGIARLHADGSLDRTFDPALTFYGALGLAGRADLDGD